MITAHIGLSATIASSSGGMVNFSRGDLSQNDLYPNRNFNDLFS